MPDLSLHIATKFLSPPDRRFWLRHSVISLLYVLFYLLLSRPEVILESKLGFTTWYPATGMMFSVLLGVSPWYVILASFTDILAGILNYHQPLLSWSSLSAFAVSGFYAFAAVALRGRFRIDLHLSRRVDVLRYTVLTLLAAAGSALSSVYCLVLDHSIAPSDYWRSLSGWFIGDAVALLALAPFLLIYVLPWVRRNLGRVSADSARAPSSPRLPVTVATWAERVAQTLAILGALWVMYGRTFAPYQLFYICFVPIVWVAMRGGIEHAVIAILALDFGIVAALHFTSAALSVHTKTGLLMLVVSATGLVVGSAISERLYLGTQLRQRTVYLDALIENSPFGIVVLDQAGKVELCNRAFETLFGFTRTEVIGRELQRLVAAQDPEKPIELSPQLRTGETVEASARRTRQDGTLVDVKVHAVPLVIDGQVRGSYALYENISAVVLAAHEKNVQQSILKSLVDELQSRTNDMALLIELSDLLQCCANLDEAYAVINKMGMKLFSSRSSGALSVFKSSRNVLELATSWGPASNSSSIFAPDACWALRRGKPHWSVNSSATLVCAHLKDTLQNDHALCIPMVAQGDTIGVLQLQVADPSEANPENHVEASLERIASSAAGQIALSIASLKLRDVLKDQSIRDPLTGLYNRRFMHEYLDRELPRSRRSNRPFSVIFMDLDHFKRFNDTFGHEAGDHVLRVFGKALTDFFRDGDVICRYGGEEFALILPDSGLEQAQVRINALREEVRKLPFNHRDTKLGAVTFSTGIAAFPVHGSTPEELFRVADQCLYQSKRAGRDRVTVPPEPAVLA